VVWLSMVAALVGNILPVFLGVLAETFVLSGQQVGFLSGAELGGTCLASLTAAYWFPRVRLRRVAMLAFSAGVLGNVATSLVNDYSSLLIVRFLTGFLGAGLLYAMTLGLIGQLKNPERVIAIAIIAQVLSLSVGVSAVPVLMSHWQLPGVTLAIALLFSTGFLLIGIIPERAAVKAVGEARPSGFTLLPAGLLAALIVFSLGLGGVWAFLERIGDGNGFSMVEMGNALAVSGLFGGAGAIVAAVMGARVHRILPLVVAIGMQMLSCFLLASRSDWPTYMAAIALFNFGWNLALPYLMGAIAATDASGRFMVLIPAAQTGGYAVGPVVVGLMMVGNDYQIAAWISLGVFAACMLMTLLFVSQIPKPYPTSATEAAAH